MEKGKVRAVRVDDLQIGMVLVKLKQPGSPYPTEVVPHGLVDGLGPQLAYYRSAITGFLDRGVSAMFPKGGVTIYGERGCMTYGRDTAVWVLVEDYEF